jgi:NitT/TauT family transport system permease protein
MSVETTVATPTTGAAADTMTIVAAGTSTQVWRRRLEAIALASVVPLCLLFLWHVMVRWTGTRLIPTPYGVSLMMWDFCFGGIYDDAYSGTLPIHLWKSVQRVYAGFFLATVTGIPLGLMLGRIPLLRAMLDPMLSLLRPVPVTAWLPLSMIFFGLGPKSAIFLVFLGAFFPIMLNTVFGVKSVDARLFEAAEMLGCSGSQMFRAVVLPAALPSILNGLRLGAGFAWILIVVGEMTGVPEGLGAVIMDGRTLSRTDLIITGMIIIGITGYFSDRILVVISKHLLRWSPQHNA